MGNKYLVWIALVIIISTCVYAEWTMAGPEGHYIKFLDINDNVIYDKHTYRCIVHCSDKALTLQGIRCENSLNTHFATLYPDKEIPKGGTDEVNLYVDMFKYTSQMICIINWLPDYYNRGIYVEDRVIVIDETSESWIPPDSMLGITVEGSGTVIINPEKETYKSTETVELKAVPADGWEFIEWSGDASGCENPILIEMNTSKSIIAIFRKKGLNFVNIYGGGTYDYWPDEFFVGDEVNIWFEPLLGYKIDEVVEHTLEGTTLIGSYDATDNVWYVGRYEVPDDPGLRHIDAYFSMVGYENDIGSIKVGIGYVTLDNGDPDKYIVNGVEIGYFQGDYLLIGGEVWGKWNKNKKTIEWYYDYENGDKVLEDAKGPFAYIRDGKLYIGDEQITGEATSIVIDGKTYTYAYYYNNRYIYVNDYSYKYGDDSGVVYEVGKDTMPEEPSDDDTETSFWLKLFNKAFVPDENKISNLSIELQVAIRDKFPFGIFSEIGFGQLSDERCDVGGISFKNFGIDEEVDYYNSEPVEKIKELTRTLSKFIIWGLFTIAVYKIFLPVITID